MIYLSAWNTYEFNDLGHLHLSEDTTRLVLTKARCVTYAECEWALDGDLARLATVQFSHPLHFRESHEVAIFKTVARFVKAGYEALTILRNAHEDVINYDS